jgi:hypothetical protein
MIIIMPERTIQDAVMSRVRFVFFLRSLKVPALVELSTIALLVAAALLFVSFENIATNLTEVFSDGSLFQYVYIAILNTEFAMQCVMALCLLVSGYFIFCMIRAIRSTKQSDEVQSMSFIPTPVK